MLRPDPGPTVASCGWAGRVSQFVSPLKFAWRICGVLTARAHVVADDCPCGGRRCAIVSCVAMFRISEAAELLGVSDDTLRRWADAGRVRLITDAGGRRAVDGVELARFAVELAAEGVRPVLRAVVRESARNRFVGLVTHVVRDTVMAQVEIQAGPHRLVSLLSREAADELGLEVGLLAVASVKATNVVVEVPEAVRSQVRAASSAAPAPAG